MPESPLAARRSGYATLVLATLLGSLAGIGIFTFGYARGGSYMTDDPAACANCHVMREQHESWMKASHRSVAVCNDCHTPAGLVPKYAVKALNGFKHSWAFTTGLFPDRIEITPFDRRITEGACLKCHTDVVDGLRSVRGHRDDVACISCHRNVGHQ
jgi:cytochrome c nitrite reductase small subunit